MKGPFRRDQKLFGCHPEVNLIFSSPGALPGWQPPDLPSAVRQQLIVHHYLRLQYYLRLHKEAQHNGQGDQRALRRIESDPDALPRDTD